MTYVFDKNIKKDDILLAAEKSMELTGIIPIVVDVEYYIKRMMKSTQLNEIREACYNSTGDGQFTEMCHGYDMKIIKHGFIGDDLIDFRKTSDIDELEKIKLLFGSERIVNSMLCRSHMSSYRHSSKSQDYFILNMNYEQVKILEKESHSSSNPITYVSSKKNDGIGDSSINMIELTSEHKIADILFQVKEPEKLKMIDIVKIISKESMSIINHSAPKFEDKNTLQASETTTDEKAKKIFTIDSPGNVAEDLEDTAEEEVGGSSETYTLDGIELEFAAA